MFPSRELSSSAKSTSAGGYLSTVNDFATLGKAILSSSFLSKTVTNRWFKPTTFVESWSAGVGRPWEIFRLKVNGKSVDWYSKSGDCKFLECRIVVLKLIDAAGGKQADRT